MAGTGYDYDPDKLGQLLDRWFPGWMDWSDETLVAKVAGKLGIDPDDRSDDALIEKTVEMLEEMQESKSWRRS